MNAKHTSGPWERQKHLPLGESTLATVAWVGDWQVGFETGIKGGNYRDGLHGDDGADAALIAAAPELLAALQATLALVESDYQSARVDGNWPDVAPIMEQARAAIAKASMDSSPNSDTVK